MEGHSLLDRLETVCDVDVDDVNTDFIRSLPFRPHHQTSNQILITDELLKPDNKDLLKRLVQEHGKQGWEDVYYRAAVQLCARNVPYVTDRVLVQISPRHINNRQAIIDQCDLLAREFSKAGVPRDRFAIKLPFSGAAASAASELQSRGIATLATAVFSLEQAIAASQAHCALISPYFQEIAAHLDPSLRPRTDDPALEETGRDQPRMIIGSHFNAGELLAMGELGCANVTVRADVLDALRKSPDTLPPIVKRKSKHPYANFETVPRLKILSNQDPLSGPDWKGALAATQVDYLANDGAKLDDFIRRDAVVRQRFQDAMDLFLKSEQAGKAAIEDEIAALGS
ncbi:transaldolase [Xylogone sp. PMI_703]|nr:transaldolase [Xylogone sp. PMI_703]